ncbi:MAG: M18 family aminopeptidase [Acidimicrobiia bacterium]|nr:M18 family aminopeptidase [Acidimicrobiia bacterium]
MDMNSAADQVERFDPQSPHQVAQRLGSFIDQCPTPYHVVANASDRIAAFGVPPVDIAEPWGTGARCGQVVQGGTLVAWSLPDDWTPRDGMRIIAAHTDSPGLRLKPHPLGAGAGWATLNVEVYGGPILHTWTNRPLIIAGRVFVRGADAPLLVASTDPVAQIPSVAIHLDRQVNAEMRINAQRDTLGVVGLMHSDSVADVFAATEELAGFAFGDVEGYDLMLVDAQDSVLIGAERELLSAPRLDNLCSSFCAIEAAAAPMKSGLGGPGVVLALFDHEEVGSVSGVGANSEWLGGILSRAMSTLGYGFDDYRVALANSWLCSADMAHATHPARPELSDPNHAVIPGGGPVLKFNASLRYTTDGESAAYMAQVADDAEVPLQRFVMRNDMPCGSTVGPSLASQLGVRAVDIGAPQLSMHSCRELMATGDVAMYLDVMKSFLTYRP